MDFLQIPNGGTTGMRLYGDDFEYMQNGIANAILGTIKRFVDANGGKLIVSGCVFTPINATTYTISGGWVVLNNQFMYFAGDTYTFSGVIDFSIVQLEAYTYDYPSNLFYRNVDGVSYNPAKRTEARLKTTATTTLPLADSNRIEKVMNALVVGAETVTANTLTLETGVTLATGVPIALSKTGSKAYFNASIIGDAGANYMTNGGIKIATLPNGFAPKSYTIIPVGCLPIGLVYLIFETNGNVRLQSLTSGFSNGSTIYINCHYITA